jgi:transcriptional regulator with XRE-family HTH domain
METKPKGGLRQNSGRPRGTQKTEASDLVARTRAKTGATQEDFARAIGCGSSTIRRYELMGLLPTEGAIRTKILATAKRAGVSLEAKAEEVTA